SSGVADDDLIEAVARGMRKINIATHLNTLFTQRAREVLEAQPQIVDPRKYLGPAKDVVEDEVARLLAAVVV
ncbi:MAG: class II fructose-bisphosphate aldolase, partial [Demequina sp.]